VAGVPRNQLMVERIEAAPAFFVNLGDFAGPGTLERHAHYLRQMDGLAIPNICVVGRKPRPRR
jgi:hypothetical protein